MNLLRLCVVLAALVFGHNSYAGSLDVMVKDDKGAPVSNAVVYAKPISNRSAPSDIHQTTGNPTATKEVRSGP